MLLNTVQCTGSPTAKNCPAQHIGELHASPGSDPTENRSPVPWRAKDRDRIKWRDFSRCCRKWQREGTHGPFFLSLRTPTAFKWELEERCLQKHSRSNPRQQQPWTKHSLPASQAEPPSPRKTPSSPTPFPRVQGPGFALFPGLQGWLSKRNSFFSGGHA